MTLTTHLQDLYHPLYNQATTHPFLTHAAHGTIPKPLLSQWLSQDRLYAQSYIRFIGALLSKTRLPNHPGTTTVENRIADLLIDALVNIRRELGVFNDVAGEFGLDLEGDADDGGGGGGGATSTEGEKLFEPNPITHSYIDLFMSASSPATTLLEGMVVLWATEICYLRAWQYARTTSTQTRGEEDADGGALRKHFIPNWTSSEFVAFVERIGEVVDEMAGLVLVEGGENREDVLGRCALWWRQVLYLEGRFWPDVS